MEGLLRNHGSWRPSWRLPPRETDATHFRHGCDPPRTSGFPLDRRPPVLSLGRLLIQIWLIAWISTVPLFPIYLPDTTDRWSILKSGGAHTIVAPDLPGEYAPPSHDSNRDSSAQLTSRAVNSPELGFILVGEQANDGEYAIHR